MGKVSINFYLRLRPGMAYPFRGGDWRRCADSVVASFTCVTYGGGDDLFVRRDVPDGQTRCCVGVPNRDTAPVRVRAEKCAEMTMDGSTNVDTDFNRKVHSSSVFVLK